MASGRDCFDIAHGKILEFLFHGVIQLLFAASRITAQRHRVGGTNGRGRRHRRDSCSNGDETTGAGRSRARWSHINHHRHRGAQKALHDRLRRIEQTARRVQLNDQTLRVLRARFINASRNVTRCRRTNRAINFDKRNLLRRDRSCAHQQEN